MTPPSTRVPLNPRRIVETAVALADDIGVDALTIRKLATQLGVKPMAIYHHLPNKEAIIDGMVDLVFGEIDMPPKDMHWRSAIRVRATSARRVLAVHPWATPLMESRRNPSPATLEHHDAVLGCFRGGGMSVRMTAHAYALLDAFIYGFALQEAGLPATEGVAMVDLVESFTDALEAGGYVHLAEIAAEHVMQPGYDFGDEFDFGLDLILDGLEASSQSEEQDR